MQQLKLALGKNKQNTTQKSKNINKSKSESMWMIQDDSDQVQKKTQSFKLNQSSSFLQARLTELFKKDKKISETTFDRIVQEFQQLIGQGKTQISYLLVIQDKITDIAEDFTGDKKKFFQQFIQMVEQRILQIRKKQKKNQLLEFDKIVKNNFKKKQNNYAPEQNFTNNNPSNFLGVASIRKRQKSASRSKSKSKNKNQSRQKSSDKPLNKLLSKQRHVKKQKWHDNEDNINQTHSQETEESVSYSAIMSASCAVKQRNRPRRNTKKKIQMQIHQVHKEDEGGEQDKEKAFVFYRPKKGK